MKVLMLGVPGVGKTSVVNGVAGHGFEVVNFGTVMFEVARDMGLVKDRDEMRTRIPTEKYKEIQKKAAERIAAMQGRCIIDTHASILKPEGYYPGLPFEVITALKPSAIIIIEADPAEVEARRQKDAGVRKREGDVAEHQLVNRYFASVYSVLTSAPLAFVQNRQGKLEEAVQQVLSCLKNVGK